MCFLLFEDVELWLGDLCGYWIDDMLVIEIMNFSNKRVSFELLVVIVFGIGDIFCLIEWFICIDEYIFFYEFTVDDL